MEYPSSLRRPSHPRPVAPEYQRLHDRLARDDRLAGRADGSAGEAPARPAEPSNVVPFPTDPATRAALLARRRARWLERALDEADAQQAFDAGYRAAIDVVLRQPLTAGRPEILRILWQLAPWEQRRQRGPWGGAA